MHIKKCSDCNKDLSLDCYYKNKRGVVAYSWCKKCHIARGQKFRETPKGKFTEMKKDAKKRGIPFTLNINDVESIWEDPCKYCGRITNILSLDRVDNSKPYEVGNVFSCCKWCNYTKGTGSMSFFYEQCKRVTENLPKELRNIGSLDDYGDRYTNSFK